MIDKVNKRTSADLSCYYYLYLKYLFKQTKYIFEKKHNLQKRTVVIYLCVTQEYSNGKSKLSKS